MDVLDTFGFRQRNNMPRGVEKVKKCLKPLVRNGGGVIYVNVLGGDLTVCATGASTYRVISLGINSKFVTPEGTIWQNICFVLAEKLVIRDAYLVKLPPVNNETQIVKCIGCSLEVVKYTRPIHTLNVMNNPISRIRFSSGLKKIKISGRGDILQSTCPAPSLQFICLRLLSFNENRAQLKRMNVKYTMRTCAFCGHQTLCETFYTYGVIKCIACYRCRLRRVQPIYNICVNDAPDLRPHYVLKPGKIFVTVKVRIMRAHMYFGVSGTPVIIPISIGTTVATTARSTALKIAKQLSYGSSMVCNITFQGVKLTLFERLWAAGVRSGSVLTAEIVESIGSLPRKHEHVRVLDLID